MRTFRHGPAAACLLLIGCAGDGGGCGGEPYFPGDELEITSVSPSFENGNVGGMVVLSSILDLSQPSEEEQALLDEVRIRITVQGNLEDLGCDQPTVIIGSRNAHVLSVSGGDIDVLAPPGPLRGGVVDVAVSCPDRFGVERDGYDYVLGSVTEEGGVGRRLEDVFKDEYASFVLYYQAEPFLNWPDPVGYGFFFNQPAPRASMYYGQDATLSYGGPGASRLAPPEVPELEFEAPEQGDRIDGGPQIVFFRERDTTDLASPVTAAARKIESSFFDGPEPHGGQVQNADSAWLVVPYRDSEGSAANRFLRIGQKTAFWCVDEQREGCTGEDRNDERLNNTRIPIDNTWSWLEPDEPDADFLAPYADSVAEHLTFLSSGTDPGIQLESGTYEDVRICKSFDEFGDFAFEPDGFCITLETIPELTITQGAKHVDLPEMIVGRWIRDTENSFYDGFDGNGESVMPRDVPVWISYEGGFTEGEFVPAKNPDMEIPDDLPEPGTAAFDEHPYLRAPDVQIDTFLGNDSDFAARFGFPADLSADPDADWRFPIAGDGTGEAFEGRFGAADGWEDSFVLVTLEVRDLNFTGIGTGTVWKTALWAWADDEYITVPNSRLATLPPIANAFKPDGEMQLGEDLLGLVTMEVHRPTSWRLGDQFRDQAGRAVIDLQAMTLYYFHNQNSCTDGLDNDGDGQIDQADAACRDPEATLESTECQNGEDDDGDGLVDADDPDCLDSQGQWDTDDNSEATSCADEVDNDEDGWVDLQDPGCENAQDNSEGGYSFATDCNNSVDDDGDGLIDFFDPGCENAEDDDEGGVGDTCNDGLDNDEDGWIDADDPACVPALATGTHTTRLGEVRTASIDAGLPCAERGCVGPGGLQPCDEDGDGLANAEDPECAWGGDPSGESGTPLECSDRVDNDGDGWIDAADPQCSLNPTSETAGLPPTTGNCADGNDNDADGWIDSLDPQCVDANSWELGRETRLECNDGTDNDNDGFIDSEDPDCPTGLDAHEDR